MQFDKPGPQNTASTLQCAYDRALELDVNELVVASTTGETAYQARSIFKNFQITAVTYHCGFRQPFENVMSEEVRQDLEAQGVRVVAATHALSGVERSVAKKHAGIYPALLIADTLKLFGQGTKVAVEISIMAADAGTLSGKDIVSVGGSAKGADAALVIKPTCQSALFDMRIREIICKPRNF